MSFPLVVLIPHKMLAPCFAVQPRPSWEKTLVYIVFPVWVVVVIVVTFLELIGTSFRFLSRSNDPALPAVQPTGGTTFDFKDLAKTFQDVVRDKLESLKRRLVMSFIACVWEMYMYFSKPLRLLGNLTLVQ